MVWDRKKSLAVLCGKLAALQGRVIKCFCGEVAGTPSGHFRLFVERRDGRRELVEDHNLVVDSGRNLLARLLAGKTANFITHAVIGNGSDPEALTDNAATFANPVYIALDSSTVIDNVAKFNFTVPFDVANGVDIHEFGLAARYDAPFGSSEGDVLEDGSIVGDDGKATILFSRRMRQESLIKSPDMKITGEWEVTL